MIDKQFAKRLKSWLELQKISVTAGAVKLGISYTYFTQLLTAKKSPGRFLKEKIDRILEE